MEVVCLKDRLRQEEGCCHSSGLHEQRYRLHWPGLPFAALLHPFSSQGLPTATSASVAVATLRPRLPEFPCLKSCLLLAAVSSTASNHIVIATAIHTAATVTNTIATMAPVTPNHRRDPSEQMQGFDCQILRCVTFFFGAWGCCNSCLQTLQIQH